MMTEQEAIDLIELAKAEIEWNYPLDYQVAFDMAIKALKQEPCRDMGEVSDGSHTFNQLYYQRAVLFATIVNSNKDKAWKSFKHFDGKYCLDRNGEWFIVGVDTPKGSYTYHYSKEYWDMFDCKELERGKEWDGHTEEDVTRLLSLEQELCEDAISRKAAIIQLSHNKNGDEDCDVIIQKDIETIKALPSVNSLEQEPCEERKQGKCPFYAS